MYDDDLEHRLDEIIKENKDAVICPNCGTFNNIIKEDSNNKKYVQGSKIFETMICSYCKHEWIIR